MTEEKQLDGMTYLVVYPKDFDPEKTYPLLVFLHGAGTRSESTQHLREENSSFRHLSRYAEEKAVMLAPLCSDIDWNFYMPTLIRLVEQYRDEPYIDADRVCLTGNSMGGYGTFALATLRPSLFAVAMPLCGGGVPWSTYRIEAAKLPVRAYHGLRDDTVDPAESVKMCAKINAGGGTAELVTFPDLGHNVWDRVYSDPTILDWFLSHRRGETRKETNAFSGKDFG